MTLRARHEAEHVTCDEAARLLGVPAAALEQWSRKLGFPCDLGAPGGPAFARDEVEALDATLGVAHSVEGAVREARRRLGRPD